MAGATDAHKAPVVTQRGQRHREQAAVAERADRLDEEVPIRRVGRLVLDRKFIGYTEHAMPLFQACGVDSRLEAPPDPAALAAALIASQWKDIARYVKISRM
jgi:hypothetical protein